MTATTAQVFRVTKDAGATLDYTLNWSDWLLLGDELTSSSWAVPLGLTLESSELGEDGTTTVWLSGGTAGTTYTITNSIGTLQGRHDDRSILVYVTER